MAEKELFHILNEDKKLEKGYLYLIDINKSHEFLKRLKKSNEKQ